ncbi:MAG: FAD-binding protein, partial [Oscillospiraceae bacterium]|nr:FAD-binding protein [Oscillospiraceae bacterium]
GGVYLADPNAVANLTSHAPEIVRWLERLGVPFNMSESDIMLRNFGGQKKKRTAYARSSTGKIIMTAVIDEVRKFEVSGLIQRFPHHAFVKLLLKNQACQGVQIQDRYTGKIADLYGTVLLCTGGLNGVFPSMTTGTTQNTGEVTAKIFSQGVVLGNLEMLQYHPTTIGISGKRCLITEAARGEGGRLYILRNGQKYYFMEEKYPELKNLMPRDVVAREMFFIRRELGGSVYLDMTELSETVWKNRLSDLREEIIHYLAIDPQKKPVPVKEGIHYFMGGIDTDEFHRTNLKNLYAAGECTCQYHGANRLGGNSMLGALYGGKKSAETIMQELPDMPDSAMTFRTSAALPEASSGIIYQISEILLTGLGIVRNAETLTNALNSLSELKPQNLSEQNRLKLAEAMLLSALERKESRGAHYREDYPQKNEAFRKTTLASMQENQVKISFRNIPERRISHDTNTISNSPA